MEVVPRPDGANTGGAAPHVAAEVTRSGFELKRHHSCFHTGTGVVLMFLKDQFCLYLASV